MLFFQEPDDDTETSVDEDPDEEYDDIEELQQEEISNQETAELEPHEQSTTEQQQQPQNQEQEVMHSNVADDVVEDEPASLEDCPSSPDVPEDPELCAKVASRFRRTSDDDKNACARCGLIYIIKRKKKEKPQASKVLFAAFCLSLPRKNVIFRFFALFEELQTKKMSLEQWNMAMKLKRELLLSHWYHVSRKQQLNAFS